MTRKLLSTALTSLEEELKVRIPMKMDTCSDLKVDRHSGESGQALERSDAGVLICTIPGPLVSMIPFVFSSIVLSN